jgi:hypothetical protein
MDDEPADSPRFGEPFLWTALFRRNPEDRSDRAGSEPPERTERTA